jgi:branched-chain amino acid transport system ATP-binding protein
METLHGVFAMFPILEERKNQLAQTLSGGEQQMLAIARGLMLRPKLILLDEPSLGLAPLLVSQIFEIIREINRKGITVLLVEQNVQRSLEMADEAFVLENGRITLRGKGQDLLADDHVKKAYLGM